MKRDYNNGTGCFGFALLILIFTLICVFGCQKETIRNSAHVYQMRIIYNNTSEWKYVKTDLVKDFGVIMQPDLQWYLDRKTDTSFICTEPWKLYWLIK
jgi:hypothetical protein